jgi:hypothetical protein
VVNRTGLVACACAAVLLVTGGCAGSPEPSVETPKKTNSKSATPSASPTPTAPVMPAAAKEQSNDGIKAFVQYYFEAFNFGRKTRDWTEFKSLSQPDCAFCNALVRPQPGRYLAGGEWEPGSYEPSLDGRTAFVTVPVQTTPGTWLPSPKAEPTSTKGDRWALDISLVHKGESWQVAEINLVR